MIVAPNEHRVAVLIVSNALIFPAPDLYFSKDAGFVLISWQNGIPVFRHSYESLPTVVLVHENFFMKLNPWAFRLFVGTTVKAVVVTEAKSVEIQEKFLRLGYSGVLRRQSSISVFRRAVRRVAGGGLWFHRQVIAAILQKTLWDQWQSHLSARESEILGFVRAGHSNRQIAEQLCISDETLRWHLRRLYSKLGTNDRRFISHFHLEWDCPPTVESPCIMPSVRASDRTGAVVRDVIEARTG